MKTRKRTVCLIVFAVFVLIMIAASSPGKIYDEALSNIAGGNYEKAAEQMDNISFYEDASSYAMYCRAMIMAQNGDHAAASETFKLLGSFSDSQAQYTYCVAYSLAFESGEDSETTRMGAEALRTLGYYELSEKAFKRADQIDFDAAKREAQKMLDSGKYIDAYYSFKRIDCNKEAEQCLSKYYSIAEGYEEKASDVTSDEDTRKSNADKARSVFLDLSLVKEFGKDGYKDSALRAVQTQYVIPYSDACELERREQYLDAISQFELLCNCDCKEKIYRDSDKRAAECREKYLNKKYFEADSQEIAGDFIGARESFLKLNNYNPKVPGYAAASERAKALYEKALYQQGNIYISQEKYEDAYKCFDKIKSYKDSDMKRYLAGSVFFADYMVKLSGPKVTVYTFDGEAGFINFDKNIMIKPTWNSIKSYGRDITLLVVEKNGKKGLVNVNGSNIFPCVWDSFTDKTLPSGVLIVQQEGLYGMVRTDGTTLVEPSWTSYELFNGSILFEEKNEDGKELKGIASLSGRIVFEAQWDDVTYIGESYIITMIENKYGIASLGGNIISDCSWDCVSDRVIREDFIVGKESEDTGLLYDLMDNTGRIISPESYIALGSSSSLDAEFKDGWMLCKTCDGHFGFIDCDGNVVSPVYEDAYEFSEQRAGVKKDGLWGFIDTAGDLVIENKYTSVTSFENGYAFAKIEAYIDSFSSAGMQNGQRFILSKSGRNSYFIDTRYASAKDYEAAEAYDEAIELYTELEDYDDSPVRILECKRKYAEKRFGEGDYEGAKALYSELEGYEKEIEECIYQINLITYNRALDLERSEQYMDSLDLFKTIDFFEDSSDHIHKLSAITAFQYYEAGRYADAKEAFETLEGYEKEIEECNYQIALATYNRALEEEAAEHYEEAVALFDSVRDFEDSADHIRRLNALYAYVLFEQGRYDESRRAFAEEVEKLQTELAEAEDMTIEEKTAVEEAIAEYENQITECGYLIGCALLEDENYEAAAAEFKDLQGYKDVNERLQECQDALDEVIYLEALELRKQHKHDMCIDKLHSIVGYKDATELLIDECRYAYKVFTYKTKYLSIIKEVSELSEEDLAYTYDYALSNYKLKQYVTCINAFDIISNYKDSHELMLKAKYAYVSSNQTNPSVRERVYDYLSDLVENNYYGAKELYDKLFGWKITGFCLNTDYFDTTTNLSSAKNNNTIYCHFTVNGGPPGETFTAQLVIKNSYDNSVRSHKVSGKDGEQVCSEFKLTEGQIANNYHGQFRFSICPSLRSNYPLKEGYIELKAS